MPTTRSKPPVFREKIFGFPISDELMRERPQYPKMMAECPYDSGEEREEYESDVCGAIMMSMSIKILQLWRNATLEETPSGLAIIALMTNKESTTTPSPELIKSMQTLLRLEVEPRWFNAS